MRLLHPINCSFVLSSNNKGRKTTPVPGELKLCSVLTAILAFLQPLYRSWPLLCHWQHLHQPSYLLSSPGFLYHGPDGVQSCTHTRNISIAVLKLTRASRIKNKLTSVGYQHTHPCLLLTMPGKSIIISYKPLRFFRISSIESLFLLFTSALRHTGKGKQLINSLCLTAWEIFPINLDVYITGTL